MWFGIQFDYICNTKFPSAIQYTDCYIGVRVICMDDGVESESAGLQHKKYVHISIVMKARSKVCSQ